jgi:hypothetical protein
MQAAQLCHHIGAGAQVQVVGVGQDNARADGSQVQGARVLTVAWVPTGMKAGVGTGP